jgi:hypothetical protein
MIDDIVFAYNSFILEKPDEAGGTIEAISLDGTAFNYTSSGGGGGGGEVYF